MIPKIVQQLKKIVENYNADNVLFIDFVLIHFLSYDVFMLLEFFSFVPLL